MGGCRCSYKNCTNTTKTRDNLHFFHYPVKQKDRCRQWIENANKPQFYDLDEDQLRNKVICETHFEDCYFPNIQKKRLLQGAIPTLDGDCEPKTLSNERVMKIQDVQVLPANADGTIFVLETNMNNSFQSEKIESYIYTNNGLVLPISKCNEIDDNMQTLYSTSEIEEIEEQPRIKPDQEISTSLSSSCETLTVDKDFDNYVFSSENNLINEDVQMSSYEKSKPRQKVSQLQENRVENSIKITDDIFSKTVGNKYVKKIKQHSKDIAILKRILKSKTPYRKPTNTTILNSLKRQVSPSLFSVINFNLNPKCEFSAEELEFFSTIHSTSPEVYRILTQKYNWKLPSPEIFNNLINKNNGHVCCQDK